MQKLFLTLLISGLCLTTFAQKSSTKQIGTTIDGNVQVFNAEVFVVSNNTEIKILMKQDGTTTVDVKNDKADIGNQTMAVGVKGVKVVLGKDPPSGGAFKVTSVLFTNDSNKTFSKTVDNNGWVNIKDLPEGKYSISVNGKLVVINLKLGKRVNLVDGDTKSKN